MSIARAILQFFGVNHFRERPGAITRGVLPFSGVRFIEGPRDLVVAEVDNMRERYSAAKYIAHLKAAMYGDFTGRGEWSRVLTSMSPDDAAAFWADFDALTDDGALVHVLTAEEREAVKDRVIEKLDEYREMSSQLMSDHGVAVETMHSIMNGEEPDMSELEDAEALVWAEDIEDEDIGGDDEENREDQGEVEFEIEVGEDPEEDGCVRSEGR